MDINALHTLNVYRAQLDKSTASALGKDEPKKSNKAEAVNIEDKVNVSPQASLRNIAFSTAINISNVRIDKVAAIKQQIANGSYTIDSRAIAEKIMASERALFR